MTMYTQSTLQRIVPSIFADSASDKTSSKYTQIPTYQIVQHLESNGFGITHAMQARSRIYGNKEFAKHILRFRHFDAKPTDSGLFPEIVLVNSHNGLSSYRLMAGVYRMVCANGLISGDTQAEVKVRHQGDILGNVVDGTYEVLNAANSMITLSSDMSKIQLNNDERMLLATTALAIRDDVDSTLINSDDAVKYLRARNYQDSKNTDLFTTFNVIQENMIKGGIRTYTRNEFGQLKRTTTRAVKSIDTNVKLNKALWTMAEEFYKLKA